MQITAAEGRHYIKQAHTIYLMRIMQSTSRDKHQQEGLESEESEESAGTISAERAAINPESPRSETSVY